MTNQYQNLLFFIKKHEVLTLERYERGRQNPGASERLCTRDEQELLDRGLEWLHCAGALKRPPLAQIPVATRREADKHRTMDQAMMWFFIA